MATSSHEHRVAPATAVASRGADTPSLVRKHICVRIRSYTLALAFARLFGHDKVMLLLVKLYDHLGKILTCLGFNPVKDAYVSE